MRKSVFHGMEFSKKHGNIKYVEQTGEIILHDKTLRINVA